MSGKSLKFVAAMPCCNEPHFDETGPLSMNWDLGSASSSARQKPKSGSAPKSFIFSTYPKLTN